MLPARIVIESKGVSKTVVLPDLKLKKAYDSDFDNILKDFYIPALSESISYKRLTGFFSSTCLAVAAKGISRLIHSGGAMELISGARFRKADLEAIIEAHESPEKVLENVLLGELESLENEFVRDHVRALGWMVAKGKLKIKIAMVCDEQDFPLDEETVSEQGIFHQKVGILEDSEGNHLSFSGSENESASGWQGNIEEFKVFRSWVEAEKDYLHTDLNKFDRFWRGYSRRTKVVDIPTAVKERLIEIAPKKIDQLDLDRWLKTEHVSTVRLRSYQVEAVRSWLHNKKKGMIEMATGTGKTFVALECLKRVLESEEKLVTVISVPYVHLIDQWIREMQKLNINCITLVASGDHPHWKDEFTNELLDIENEITQKLIVLTTHVTLSSKTFTEIIRTTSAKLLLIADEAHSIGAPKRKAGLIENYTYRLGLSATPRRWFDPEGTEDLYRFFEDVVFEFPLKKAIGRFLTEYVYDPYFVELTSEELERYREETLKIGQSYYRSKDVDERRRLYSLLCIRRQNIVKNSINKYKALERILDEAEEVKHGLIYCSPQQIDNIQDILNRKGIIQHKFTQIEGTKPEEKYGNISERQHLLQKLAEGVIDVLVAMRCLDEGVDIPNARLAVMMSNSGNPREYIQRRGRILRKHPSKPYATIYDVIVTPAFKSLDRKLGELERKIFAKELRRYKEFSSTARNSVECLERIDKLEQKYGVFG